MDKTLFQGKAPIGVGLRHAHYHEALTTPAELDFVEVHSENFFAKGGATLDVLEEAAKLYPISLHGTSLGLGSATGIPRQHLDSLASLVSRISPVMISDHAAFAWGELNKRLHHGGDLLPIAFNRESLQILADNVNRVQDRLQRTLFVENLSAYITPEGNNRPETNFLNELTELTQCRLLVDLNNVAVNAANDGQKDIAGAITQWIDEINPGAVGEIHLAGCTPALPGEFVIDDHSQKVSDPVWQAYRHALGRFGPVPTLIEWDTDLPEWTVLLAETQKAKVIAQQVVAKGESWWK